METNGKFLRPGSFTEKLNSWPRPLTIVPTKPKQPAIYFGYALINITLKEKLTEKMENYPVLFTTEQQKLNKLEETKKWKVEMLLAQIRQIRLD